MIDIENKLKQFSSQFNNYLPQFFPLPSGAEKRVVEAMKYSVMNGGKRLRPFLVCETAQLFDKETQSNAMLVGASLEMLHSYSLIHDDLPAMDNDDLRRGKPTCHKQFDEATAILAGDGLLTYAFELLASDKNNLSAADRCQLVLLLSQAAGAFNGMVAGQMLDLYAEKTTPQKNEEQENLINDIEAMKTGRLFRYACEAGAVLGGASDEQRQALINYSRKIGAAFQIADDILDVEGNAALMGKRLQKDSEQGKITFVSLYGLEQAKELAQKLINDAKHSLDIFGNKALSLQSLAEYFISRNR